MVIGFRAFLRQHDFAHTCSNHIVRIDRFGLVENVQSPHLATSVDGIVTMRKNDGTLVDPAAIEVKTHTVADTIRAARQRAQSLGKVTKCFLPSDENSQDESFETLVPDDGYRLQLLHHAAVLCLANVCYVEASTTEILRIMWVTVTTEVWDLQRFLFNFLGERAMRAMDNDNPLVAPEDYVERCPDQHTLQQTLALWKAGKALTQ